MRTDDEATGVQPTSTDHREVTTGEAKPWLSGARYRVGQRIGHGGMGEVLVARDEQIGRDVAIKRLHARDPNERQVTRFLHEARIQGRLDHPAIVPVYDLGLDDSGQPFFVMKKLAGTTLTEILKREAPRQRLLRAFAEICLAIEFAHVHGVVHRDIKPDNIVLGDFGEVYVLDWGVAKVVGESDDFEDLHGGAGTEAGAQVGTRGYMSPEQLADSAAVDARSDVFALGKVLAKILASEPDPPPELGALVDAAVEPDRDARIATARELGAHVQAYLDGDRDLELRKKLARVHLEHARAAFAAGLGDEDRGVAIRAASSAMALDPTLAGAPELVGRLMLEPPREMPPAVQKAIEDEDVDWMFAQTKALTNANILALVMGTPCLVILGSPIGAMLFAAFAVFAIAGNSYAIRDRARFRTPPPIVLGLLNAIGLAVMSRIWGPTVVAPAAAVVVGFSMAAMPGVVNRRTIIAIGVLLFAGAFAPLVAEQIGVVSSTIDVTADGVLLHPPAHFRANWMVLPMMGTFVACVIGCAILIARTVRAHERAHRRQLHMQAWQLKQLVTG